MTTRPLIWIAIGLAALALAIFFGLDPGVEGGTADELGDAAPTGEPEPSARELLEEPARLAAPSETRAPIAEPAQALATTAAPATPEPEALLRVRGVVLDPLGAPVADVEVGVDGRDERARTDNLGRFELSLPRAALGREVTVVAAPHIALRTALADEGAELLLVACASLSLAGRTVDERKAPLPGTRVEAFLSRQLLRDFPRPLDTTRAKSFVTTSDDEGRFQLEVPKVPGYILAKQPHHSTADLALPETDRSDLELVFRAMRPGLQANGVVLLPDRTPAAGARVHLGNESALADERGEFAVKIALDLRRDALLAAGLEGFAPALIEHFGEIAKAAQPGSPPPVELVLGPDLAIQGRVVDVAGAPCARWIVFLADGTPVRDTDQVLAESVDWVGGPRPFETDAEGGFAIGSLLERSYVLRARDPRTLLEIESAPIDAGTQDALLLVGGDLLHARVRGRVLSRRGAPIAGVDVEVCTLVETARSSQWITREEKARTDELGGFELRDVPRSGVLFQVAGSSIIPRLVELERGYDPDGLEIEIARRAHFRATVRGVPTAPDPYGAGIEVELRDAAGAKAYLYHFEVGLFAAKDSERLSDEGRSRILSAAEDTAELVVLDGDTVLARWPLALDPDLEVNEIEIDLAATR